MRLLVVFSALILFGCSNDSEPQGQRDAEAPEASVSRPYPPMPETPSDPGDTQCHKSEHIVFHLDGGFTVTYDVPLPCDPFWKLKDRGDHPP